MAIPRSLPAAGAAALAAALLTFAPPVPARAADSAAEHLAAGAEKYAHGDLKGAYEEYFEALKVEPGDFTALHRLSRAESELGEEAKGEEQRRLVGAAVQHARDAVKAAPDSAQGHLALAVALGRQALKEGPRTRLSLSREIKSEVDRALAINPSLGRAWHVRAMWNRKLASLNFIERAAANTVLGGVPKGASMDNAVADLNKAIALEPDYVNHHLELGRTCRMLKRNAEARRELERAVALPPTSSPRDPRYQAEARKLLAKLGKD